jgi:tRNA threonylcarbamoyladenosine biosynthesis protein TsaE
MSHQAWVTRSGEETEALASRLLKMSRLAADSPLVIELSGDLGTGKSTFARGALRALGATGPIKSPSYTLLETYDLPATEPALTGVHLDLYRLNDPEELEHLGLSDYHRPGFLWLIEWPEKAAGRLPPPDQRFQFSIENEGHRIERIETSPPTK